MKITFRTDASVDIGSGHVMRCLTLAQALKGNGHTCEFICRAHPGNLITHITDMGFQVHTLSANAATTSATLNSPTHLSWLGSTQLNDAQETLSILEGAKADWLVVDHYALDAEWEINVQNATNYLMVIDDVADRPHKCDLLLDQNLGRKKADYEALVPSGCRLLLGTDYALLRPEFTKLRPQSISARNDRNSLTQILISMGGIDKHNITRKVLLELNRSALPLETQICVVMGAHAPWITDIHSLAALLPWHTEVKVSVDNMAELMMNASLAIGAAGSTSWERCCLGVPTILTILASNQREIAKHLVSSKAALLFDPQSQIADNSLPALIEQAQQESTLNQLSSNAARLCDGAGADRVVERMLSPQTN